MARVLVVDDSRLTRRLIVSALEKAGHEVTQGVNGVDGLEKFHDVAPDCVMSDLLMPEMDGFGLAEAIREINEQVPILIATADIQEKSRERCQEIRVTRMLNKPLKSDEIVAAVDEALCGQEVAG